MNEPWRANYTPSLGLPLLQDEDKPSWRGDFNGSMNVIDDAFTGLGVVSVHPATHEAVQQAFDANPGKKIVASGEYETNKTLRITGPCDLSGLTIKYTGGGYGIEIGTTAGPTFRTKYLLPYLINPLKTQLGWDQPGVAGSMGVRLINLYSCTVEAPYIYNFEVGMGVFGANNKGSQQNIIYTGHLDNNKANLRLGSLDATGWSNQNTYIGGRLSHISNEGSQVPGTVHVDLAEAPNSVNGNVFVGTSFESAKTVEYHVTSHSGIGNLFLGCRWENSGGAAMRRVLSDSRSRNNQVIGGMYADSLVSVNINGGQPWTFNNGNRERLFGQSSTIPTEWIENSSGNTAPAIIVTEAGAAAANVDPDVSYAFRVSGSNVKMKRANDSFPRIQLDMINGAVKLGNGTADPAFALTGVGQQGMVDGHLTWRTDGGGTLGTRLGYRPSYVYASKAIVTASGPTSSRPPLAECGVGAMYFDTTLVKPIWATANYWVDATGAQV